MAYGSRLRSIPACAGQPVAGPARGLPCRVYPRVCGATVWMAGPFCAVHGLSPRVRGNPFPFVCESGWFGSIPACAGQPKWRLSLAWPTWVYPRVCGATPYVSRAVVIEEGLSPRVRGNLSELNALNVRKRSIPACAGQPGQIAGDHRHHPVYPRVCGATDGFGVSGYGGPGLSPRVRGNQAAILPPSFRSRSIPACAGQPFSQRPQIKHAAVYPRVCGATSMQAILTLQQYGLSPRVRGNLRQGAGVGLHIRSIPACAGQPRRPQ